MINNLLKKIKQNKKYKSIADEIVVDEIKKYLKSNPNAREDKQTISEIRAKLHRLYSSYQNKKKNKRNDYLEELKQNMKNNQDILDITNKLISTMRSSKERINNYKNIYQEIFKITKKPKTILDLGAGINLVSYPLMNLKSLTYYSYDIDEKDIEFLNNYFKIMKAKGLKGKAAIINLRNLKKIFSLPSSNIIFIWKTIDLIDEKKRKISEELIKILIKKTDYIVISFATSTLSGKSMNLPKRRGFELMLDRNNLKFKTIEIDNEIFYVVSKN